MFYSFNEMDVLGPYSTKYVVGKTINSMLYFCIKTLCGNF